MIVQQILTVCPPDEMLSGERGVLSANVIFTTVVTLAIFILGYMLTALIERRKKYRERNNLRLMVIEWLRQLSIEIDSYVASLKRIAGQMAEPKQSDVFVAPYMSVINLEGIPVERLYETFGLFLKESGGEETVKQQNLYTLLAIRKSIADMECKVSDILKEYMAAYDSSRLEVLGQYRPYMKLFGEAELLKSEDRLDDTELEFYEHLQVLVGRYFSENIASDVFISEFKNFAKELYRILQPAIHTPLLKDMMQITTETLMAIARHEALEHTAKSLNDCGVVMMTLKESADELKAYYIAHRIRF